MYNNNGSTLIESLFAFQIYIFIIILLITLLLQIYKGENRLKSSYYYIQSQEEKISYQESFVDIINMVLP